ncbi:MCE family protein [Aeromicrobium sp. Leaf350]|uniref:MCE family protein n=1 Tax=Aeromicrobium sp. Leaf350 TaxID=2876565 RepID=UPI001E3B6F7B|nr:MCE family protein [Aeromicrobium sp. Leaf350]
MTAAYISRDLEHRGGALVQRGVATVIVLALVVAGFFAVQGGVFSDQVDVQAQVDDVGGALAVGNDVKLRGAIIGRVTSIEARDEGVRLGLSLDPDEADRLPAEVTARILPATVFGTSFVDLVPPERPAGTFQAGSVIQQDPSSRTRELQDALDSSFEILTAVEPARLSTTLGAFAQALDGRGESLGASLVTLDRYLTRLEPQLPQVGEDLRLLATNLTTIAQVAPDLLDALESSFVTTRTVVDRQADLASVLTGGDDLVDEAQLLVSSTQPAFVKAVTQSAPLVETMFDRRAGFAETFDSLVELATIGATSFTDPDAGATAGGYLETTVEIVVNTDAPYTAADCAVFGPPAYRAAAGSCGGSGPATTTTSPADDAALVAEIQGLLAQLESVAASDPNGIGDLLTRGFVGGGGDS